VQFENLTEEMIEIQKAKDKESLEKKSMME
jgi:hypothetical protein